MVTFAHLSDPHIAPVPTPTPAQLLGKRFFSHISWRRKRARIHRRNVLEALGRDLTARRPEHVAVTGDLVNLSLPAEFAAAADWLQTLGSPSEVSVVPGNHDALVRTRWANSWAHWADYMACDLADDGERPRTPTAFNAFPYAQIRPPLALVGLSSARPTPPFLAAGWIGKRQRAVLAQYLRRLRRAGLFRVVMVHHPLTVKRSAWRRGLWDAEPLRRTLADAGAELILHGHGHKFASTQIDTADGLAPVIGVPSASALDTDTARLAHYHLYTVTRTEAGWRLDINARGYDRTSGEFVASGGRCFELGRDLPARPAQPVAAE